MALDVAKLKAEFLKVMDRDNSGFLGYTESASENAEKWTNAYDVYAQATEDASGDSPSSVNRDAFKGHLETLFSNIDGSISDAVLAYGSAFLDYWTSAAFVVGKPPPDGVGGNGIFGVEQKSDVIIVTNVGLMADLTTIFGDNDPGSVDERAEELADAFHKATTTEITVLIMGLDTSTPSPLPITNTNTVS
jgi:hypothetical protein